MTFTPFQLLDERKPCHVAADDSGVLFASGLTGVSYQRRPGVADEAKLHLAPSSTARTAESDACHLDSRAYSLPTAETAQLLPIFASSPFSRCPLQIPLFGLQHILLPFRPEKGCSLERYYQIGAALLISLQGLCVSCLFCFANHDVIFAVQCYLSRFFPDLVTHPFLESNGGQPATQSRDVVV